MSDYKKYTSIILLPIITVVCIGLWAMNLYPLESVRITSENAVFDVREVDFSEHFVNFNRIVEYIPDEMLSPEEFDKREDIIIGEVPIEVSVSTMRIKILANDDMVYGITGYSVNYASSVYVNGKWIFDEGKPAYTIDEEKSSESYRVFSAEPVNGVIEILIQTSAFSNYDTSTAMGWMIGDYETLRIGYTRRITIDIVLMAFYLILSLISLLLFLALPQYRANGWLSLLSLVWLIRTGLKNTKILLTLLPPIEWSIVYKIEILTSPLTIILIILIIHSIFPKALPSWLRITGIGSSLIGVLIVFVLPWWKFFGHSVYTNTMIYISLSIMLVFIIISINKNRPNFNQVISFSGVILAIFSFVWDKNYFGYNNLPFSISQPVFIIFLFFLIVSAILATIEKYAEREKSLIEKIAKKDKEIIESRITTMMSQITPHFLFNSLLVVQDLCVSNPKEAEEAVKDFSNYLRGNIDALSDNSLIPFSKELEHVKSYTALEKRRFEERLTIEFDIESQDFFIPPLTLQPIVENAINHGVNKRVNGGKVIIHTWETDDCNHIAVIDNGIGFNTLIC